LGVVVCAFVVGVCFALFAGAYNFVSSGRITWLGLLFWAIFLWWQLLPIMVAGFGASFDFRAMLRFPLSFAAFYIIGLAYGLADFTGVAAVCWIIAVVSGVAAAGLTLLPAVLLMAALFIAFNVALERLVGSWMERLMAGRRTRELFFAGFILLMLSLQLLGPFLNRYGDSPNPCLCAPSRTFRTFRHHWWARASQPRQPGTTAGSRLLPQRLPATRPFLARCCGCALLRSIAGRS